MSSEECEGGVNVKCVAEASIVAWHKCMGVISHCLLRFNFALLIKVRDDRIDPVTHYLVVNFSDSKVRRSFSRGGERSISKLLIVYFQKILF